MSSGTIANLNANVNTNVNTNANVNANVNVSTNANVLTPGNLRISHLFGSYPVLENNTQFIPQLSAKQEFAELASEITEPSPRPGQYYPHQVFAARLLQIYQGNFLVIDDPGTGKSCLVTLSGETFKKEYLKSPNNPTKIKRGVILVRNPTLIDNIKTQILCYCTAGDYLTEKVRSQTETQAMRSAITESLKTFYDIMTYGDFFKKLEKYQREEDRISYMSNKIFFLDEGHNLIKDKTLSEDLDDVDMDLLAEMEDDEAEISLAEHNNSVDDSDYVAFWKIFHLGHRNRFIILTATPMINTTLSFSFLMNLILPIKALSPQNIEDYTNTFTKYPDVLTIDYSVYRDLQGLALESLIVSKTSDDKLRSALSRINISPDVVDSLLKAKESWLIPWWVYKEIQDSLSSTTLTNTIITKKLENISGQMPNYGDEANLEALDFQDFNRYLNGRVLYTRALETGAKLVYAENPDILNADDTLIKKYYCSMSAKQYLVYYNTVYGEGSKKKAFRSRDKQISTLIYPNNRFGRSGSREYMSLDKGLYNFIKGAAGTAGNGKGLQLIKDYKIDMRNPEASKLQELSCKGYEIVKTCIESYTDGRRLPVPNEKGVVFVYDPDFLYGSGAADIAAMFVANGYELFSDTVPIFVESDVGNDNNDNNEVNMVINSSATACPTSNVISETKKKARYEPKKRVAILSGSSKPAEATAIINTVNDPENRYGQYLQVIVASKIAQEGISINHAVKMFMVRPPWNFSRMWQAMNRVFRATSHNQRIANMIRDLTGINFNNLANDDNNKFPVQVYLMAAIYLAEPDLSDVQSGSELGNLILQYGGTYNNHREDKDNEGFDILNDDLDRLFNDHPNIEVPESLTIYRDHSFLLHDNDETVDNYLYDTIARKDRSIRRIMRFCRMSAANCLVNYNRNVRDDDIDGSSACDYELCRYVCSGCTNKLPADWSTKILNYSQNEVYLAKVAVQNILRDRIAIQLIDLVKNVNMRPIYVYEALSAMISKNDVILDKNGYFCYIRDRADGLIYLQRDFFSKDTDPYYNQLFINQSRLHDLFVDYTAAFGYEQQKHIFDQIFALNEINGVNETDNEGDIDIELPILLEQLTLLNKVQLLEHVIKRKFVQQLSSPVSDAIIDFFNYAIFTLEEPIEKIQNESTYRKVRKQGKPQVEVSKMRISQSKKSMRQKQEERENANVANGGASGNGSGGGNDNEITGDIVVLHSLLGVTSGSKTSGRLRLLKIENSDLDSNEWRDLTPPEYIVYVALTQLMRKEEQDRFKNYPIYGVMMPPLNHFKIRDRKVDAEKLTKDGRYDRDGKRCNLWTYPDMVDLFVRLGISHNQPIPAREDMLNVVNNPRLTDRQLFDSFIHDPTIVDFMTNYLLDAGFTKAADLYDMRLYDTYMWYYNRPDPTQLCNILYNYFVDNDLMMTGLVSNQLNQIDAALDEERAIDGEE